MNKKYLSVEEKFKNDKESKKETTFQIKLRKIAKNSMKENSEKLNLSNSEIQDLPQRILNNPSGRKERFY